MTRIIQKRFGIGVALAMLAAAPLAGCPSGGGGGGAKGGAREIEKVPEGAVDTKVDRFKVPLGAAPVKGPGNAKVTIIEWSDFQCPFCSRVGATMEQIEKAYGKDVRLAFKHNPLPFHQQATPAAYAAVAAQKQGDDKFWKMHDTLFKNQQALDAPSLEKYATEIGLDVAKWKKDFESQETKDLVAADMKGAAQFGARGTPAFFINGRNLSGAQPFDNFKKIIDEEMAAADKAIKAGVGADQVYDALTKAGKTSAPAPEAQKAQQPPAQDNTVYKVPAGDSPAIGPADAEVTIIQFSDFQCPFCSRVEVTLDEVKKNYGDKVRVVWKNNPLPFHADAMPAAMASLAAHQQGKFWAMHKKMFENQKALDAASLEKYAGEIGLNMGKFKAALTDEKLKKSIEADMALATQLNARGTPAFFVNGRNLKGAQPYDNFKAKIEEGIKDAQAVIAKGVSKAKVYEELIKAGKEKAEAPAAPQKGQPPAADTTVYKAALGDAPVKGPKDAKVTIVMWSDFQCPFCSRVVPTIDQVLKAYPKDVRFAFKQLPLPFHDKAHAAAEASLAAKEQGKFWEMHDALFAKQQELDRAGLEKRAGELGLNLAKFKDALDSGKYKKKVDDELAEGNKIGARGTPSFFVNGKSFVGAQPFENFKTKIDEEIKNADALMAAKKIKADKVYDELMKDAKDSVPAPAAQKPGEPEQEDKTIYKVEPGNGPSKGPANAPVQIVEFSDFQCPFCSRVIPTTKQIFEKYGNKVRVTWRNYPLPFHQNAKGAAEAGLAANEQGKFWEMHDAMFAKQQELDRPGLEKRAQEIGLDVGKFKAALDSGKFKKSVDDDFAYGSGLPGGGMGTPTFFINGRKLAGAYPFDAFAKIIDEELAKKK